MENNSQPQSSATSGQNDVKAIVDNLSISADDRDTLNAIVGKLKSGQLDADTIATIAQGITHNADVENAEAQGYLRGKNEQIEALAKFADDDNSEPVNFPRYARRSIWDR